MHKRNIAYNTLKILSDTLHYILIRISKEKVYSTYWRAKGEEMVLCIYNMSPLTSLSFIIKPFFLLEQ